MEMPGREVRHLGQRRQVQGFGQMGVDVVDDAVDAAGMADGPCWIVSSRGGRLPIPLPGWGARMKFDEIER